MAGEDNKEERSPSQATIENTVAIGQLVTLQERTTSDIDKLVRHIEKILPVHEQIATMRKILYSSIALAIVYASWVTLELFGVKEAYAAHNAAQKEHYKAAKDIEKEMNRKINYNKNQITYLKGAKMNKPKG